MNRDYLDLYQIGEGPAFGGGGSVSRPGPDPETAYHWKPKNRPRKRGLAAYRLPRGPVAPDPPPYP